MAGTRDALVNVIGKAIDTGMSTRRGGSPIRDQEFFAGRVTAFVYSAAILAEQCYGMDFDAARFAIRTQVDEVRKNTVMDKLRDAEWVGQAADTIVLLTLEAN